MVLVDTSVWVSHLRHANPKLQKHLLDAKVVCHPFIIGELACGNLKNRQEILTLMKALPTTIQAEHEEVLRFIEMHGLMRKGLGYIDVHLLASTLLSGVSLWTEDMQLKKVARKLEVPSD